MLEFIKYQLILYIFKHTNLDNFNITKLKAPKNLNDLYKAKISLLYNILDEIYTTNQQLKNHDQIKDLKDDKFELLKSIKTELKENYYKLNELKDINQTPSLKEITKNHIKANIDNYSKYELFKLPLKLHKYIYKENKRTELDILIKDPIELINLIINLKAINENIDKFNINNISYYNVNLFSVCFLLKAHFLLDNLVRQNATIQYLVTISERHPSKTLIKKKISILDYMIKTWDYKNSKEILEFLFNCEKFTPPRILTVNFIENITGFYNINDINLDMVSAVKQKKIWNAELLEGAKKRLNSLFVFELKFNLIDIERLLKFLDANTDINYYPLNNKIQESYKILIDNNYSDTFIKFITPHINFSYFKDPSNLKLKPIFDYPTLYAFNNGRLNVVKFFQDAGLNTYNYYIYQLLDKNLDLESRYYKDQNLLLYFNEFRKDSSIPISENSDEYGETHTSSIRNAKFLTKSTDDLYKI